MAVPQIGAGKSTSWEWSILTDTDRIGSMHIAFLRPKAMLNSTVAPRQTPPIPAGNPVPLGHETPSREVAAPALARLEHAASPSQTLRQMALQPPAIRVKEAPAPAQVSGPGSATPKALTPSPEPMTIERATSILDKDFSAFDTAADGGEGDGKIGQSDLKVVAENTDQKYSDEQVAAAQFLLDSNASRNFLDKAANKGWGLDGVISRDDVTAAQQAIADGSYTHRMLDTAATGTGWFSGPDGNVSQKDIDAALADPGIPQAVKAAIGLAREGKPDADVGFLSELTADKAKAASELIHRPEYSSLSPSDKAIVAQAWRASRGDTAAASDFKKLLADPRFQAASAPLRTDLLRGVGLQHSDAFKALPASDQQLIRDTLASRGTGDTRLAQSLSALVHDKRFQSLSADEKTAVLSQVHNYPTSKVADNFQRLMGKEWFQSQSLEDKQRSLKTIAFLTDYKGGDRTILDNTLNKLLDAAQPFKMIWEAQNPGVGAHYKPGTNTISMNSTTVPADNQPVSSSAVWQIVNAVPHEINHAIDDVHVSATFDYLSKEYQAYYTGNQAQSGRPMTRDEAVSLWRDTLLNTRSIYGVTASAALADATQSQQIFAYLSRLTGVTVTADNYQTILRDRSAWNPPYDASKGSDIGVPAGARPVGNTDNR